MASTDGPHALLVIVILITIDFHIRERVQGVVIVIAFLTAECEPSRSSDGCLLSQIMCN